MPKLPSSSSPKPIPLATPPARAPRLTRWALLLGVAGVFAIGVGSLSGDASFDDRLIDIAAKDSLSPDVYRLSRKAPAMQALLLDVAADRDITAKVSLGLEKYGEPGRDVLEAYGKDLMFRDQLRRYGEGIIPVIAYFRAHDIGTLRARYKAARVVATVKKALETRLGGKKLGTETETPPAPYDAALRGLHAIERIHRDGHNFLGQFNVDGQGVAHWSQTERALESLEALLFGNVRALEQRHDLCKTSNLADYVGAGADVLVVASAAKALIFLKSARAASATARGVGVVDRVKLSGGKALADEVLGRSFVRWGAKVRATYVMVAHPSLANAVAIDWGRWLGLPALASVSLFWWVVAFFVLVLVVPVLRGIGILATPLLAIARMARWLMPARIRKLSGTAVA